MIRPTKKNQEQWIKKHLNGGECPKDFRHWSVLRQTATTKGAPHLACLEALEWLAEAEPDITTLAEAWDRCPRGEWLAWALCRMRLTKKDWPKLTELCERVLRADWLPSSFGARSARNLLRTAIEDQEISETTYWLGALLEEVVGRRASCGERCADLIRKVFGNPWRTK
jgi:hypothetical protein